VEVIEPAEESRYTVTAVRRALGKAAFLRRRDALIVDVGGGSALLTLLQRGRLTHTGSYPLGSVRLQEVLGTSRERPKAAADLLRHQIAGVVSALRQSLKLKKIKSFIAVGGDARLAARQVKSTDQDDGIHRLDRQAFIDFADACAEHSVEDLARRYALPFADAQTLVPALLAYQHILEETSATEVIVSDVSMRDGLLLDVVRGEEGIDDSGLIEATLQSARSLAAKYGYDEPHGNHVSDLAVAIFDALQNDHGMTPRQRLLLQVAGIVHEVGSYVGSSAHHKHSYYLISNSGVFGLRRDELEIVAQVSRYHRRSAPRSRHVEYMALPKPSRMLVSRLAAILRVADALDHGHSQQIRDVRFQRSDDEFVIIVPHVADLSLERRNLAGKVDLFEDVYGMTVRLESAKA
jgi:exopolyphosphatase/guanosine-5'-triphosphate,3'-diphosphate pyrophosphatase